VHLPSPRGGQALSPGSMRKAGNWSDPGVAAEYERRRFTSPLQRLKHRRDESLVAALLEETGEGALVLDLPAGTGRLLRVLTAGGRRVVAADLSLAMLRARVGLPPGVLGRLQASAFELPFRSASFDAVVSLRFLFHLDDRAERVRVLRELGRVSRGVVLGQVRFRGTFKHLGRWARSRVGLSRRYAPSSSRADVAGELEEAGLRLDRLVPVSRAFSDKALFLAKAPVRRQSLSSTFARSRAEGWTLGGEGGRK